MIALIPVSTKKNVWLLCYIVREFCSQFLCHQFKVSSTDAECNILKFILLFLKELSAWVIVNLTLERATAVMFPLHCKEWFTKLKAANFLVINVLILLLLNIHAFWIYGFVKKYGTCIHEEGWRDTYTHIWPYVGIVLYAVLPFTILIVCNSMICGTLCRAHGWQKSGLSTTVDQTKLSPTILVLLTLSLTFIITTLPRACLSMYIFSVFGGVAPTSTLHTLLLLLISVQSINYACHLFLYVISGSKFRTELSVMCKSCSVSTVENEDNT